MGGIIEKSYGSDTGYFIRMHMAMYLAHMEATELQSLQITRMTHGGIRQMSPIPGGQTKTPSAMQENTTIRKAD